MSRNLLISIGCSYTDKNFKSCDDSLPDNARGGWDMWPEIMAKDLGLKSINCGYSGVGTDHMFNAFVSAISEYGDKIDTIAILLSGSDRCINYQILDMLPLTYLGGFNHDLEMYGEIAASLEFFNKCEYVGKAYNKMVSNHYIKILSMIELCQYHNIKFVMKQGVTMFPHWAFENLEKYHNAQISKSQVSRYILKCKSFQAIDKSILKNNIIGWPLYSPLGGESWDDTILYDNTLSERYCISPNDGHPNALGQTLIADSFLKKYKELYKEL